MNSQKIAIHRRKCRADCELQIRLCNSCGQNFLAKAMSKACTLFVHALRSQSKGETSPRMTSAKKILLSAFVGVILISIFILYWNWSERNSRGAPSPTLVCRKQLREIDAAEATWSVDHNKTTNDIPTRDDLRPYLARHGEVPVCPSGGTYTLGRVGESPVCSHPGHTLD